MPRVFWWLWSGALLSALATFVFPFLALYLTAQGVDAQRAGLLVSLLGVGAMCAGPLAGTVADRRGRKPAVLIALAAAAAASAYLAFVQSPLLLAPGVLVFGIGSAMVYPSVNAIVADVVPPERVQRGFGLLYWANNLGVGLSALVGGALAAKSWRALFLSDAVTTVLFAALVASRIPETRPQPKGGPLRGWSALLADRQLVAFLAVQLGFLLVFWQFQFAVPLAMAQSGLGAAAFGPVLAANCIFILIGQPLAARWLSRVDEGLVLAAAALLLGAGYGAYALCSTAPQYIAATLLWTLGEMTGLPACSAVVARLAPEDLRGRYQGAFMTTMSVAMTAAPVLAGAVISHAGLRALWLGCLGLCSATSVGHLVLVRARRRPPAVSTCR